MNGTLEIGFLGPQVIVNGKPENNGFGGSVSIDGDTAVIGATARVGKAYVTEYLAGEGWSPIMNDTDSDLSTQSTFPGTFGFRVAVDDDLMLVSAISASKAFLFRRVANTWIYKKEILQPEDGGANDRFGHSVAISGRNFIVGAGFNTGAASIFVNVPFQQFDFDSDTLANISVMRPVATPSPTPSPTPYNTWYIRAPSGGYTETSFGISSDILTPADFDGDGKTDVAVFRPSDGTWYVQGTTQGFFSNAWGQAGDIPVPNDLNGDGKADFVVFRTSTSTWYWKFSSDQSFSGLTCSAQSLDCGQSDIPIIGDFDGNQRGELAFFRPSTGLWQWYDVTTQAVGSKTSWGTTDDIAVPADYDGDLKTDFVIFRPSNSTWYRWYSSLESYSAVAWGAPGDKPVPADYDGDGETDIAVFRPSENIWYIRNSSYVAPPGYALAPQTSTISFGTSGDIPIPSVFQP